MRTAAVTLACLATLGLAADARGRPRQTAESYATDIEILDDGTLRVTEEVRFRLESGPWTHVDRDLPRRHLDTLAIEGGSDSLTIVPHRDRVRVVWHFAAVRDTVRTLRLTYLVRGALRRVSAGTQLRWSAFPDRRRYVIEQGRVRLRLPPGWPPPVAVSTRPGRHIDIAANVASVDAGRLERDRAFVLHAELPPHVVAAAPPAWQERQAERRARAPMLAALAAALLLAAAALVLVIYREVAPPRLEKILVRSVHAPPSDLRPALAGSLHSGRAGFGQAIACCLDLAARGYLRFEERAPESRWQSKEHVLVPTRTPEMLAPWERVVFDAAARGTSGGLPLAKAWASVRAALADFRAAVHAALVARGEWEPSSGERGRRLREAGIFLGALAGAACAAAAVLWRELGPPGLLPAAALGVAALAALVAAAGIRRSTPRGAWHAAKWRGFARYLKATAKARAPLDAARFAAWLPYAVALDVGPAWIQAGRKHGLEPPAWYRPLAGQAPDMSPLVAVLAPGGSAASH